MRRPCRATASGESLSSADSLQMHVPRACCLAAMSHSRGPCRLQTPVAPATHLPLRLVKQCVHHLGRSGSVVGSHGTRMSSVKGW
jgi:hypothetical protein